MGLPLRRRRAVARVATGVAGARLCGDARLPGPFGADVATGRQ